MYLSGMRIFMPFPLLPPICFCFHWNVVHLLVAILPTNLEVADLVDLADRFRITCTDAHWSDSNLKGSHYLGKRLRVLDSCLLFFSHETTPNMHMGENAPKEFLQPSPSSVATMKGSWGFVEAKRRKGKICDARSGLIVASFPSWTSNDPWTYFRYIMYLNHTSFFFRWKGLCITTSTKVGSALAW